MPPKRGIPIVRDRMGPNAQQPRDERSLEILGELRVVQIPNVIEFALLVKLNMVNKLAQMLFRRQGAGLNTDKDRRFINDLTFDCLT